MKKNDAVRFVLFAGLLIGTAIPVGAQTTFSAHVEGGFGASVVRPLVSEGASSAMGSAGASARIDRRLRVGLEVTAMAGGPTGMRIPEAATPGDRSLTTFLIGLESTSRDRSRGAFGFIGAGAGHMSLSDATGVFEPPFDRWLVPPRSLTAFAIGAAAGYRFAGGPGPLGFQLGFRTQSLVHGGRIPASACALTFGWAY
jgi:hypothetical protein